MPIDRCSWDSSGAYVARICHTTEYKFLCILEIKCYEDFEIFENYENGNCPGHLQCHLQ